MRTEHGRPAAGPAPNADGDSIVAVLAGQRRRGSALVRMLRANGIPAAVVDADGLSAHIRDGTSGGAVVVGDVLRSAMRPALLQALDRQPDWSDFAFVVVSERRDGAAQMFAGSLPNAVVVPRPLRREALVSAARSAVRARRRQRVAALPVEAGARPAQVEEGCPQLVYASRVSAMGEMASALAHEVNQPLSTTANYVAGCRRLLAGVTGAGTNLIPLFDALAVAEAETMRAGEIVRRMRETLAVRSPPRERARVVDIVAQACAIAEADDPGTCVDVQVRPGDMMVAVDAVAVQHVIVSLVKIRAGQPRADERRRVLIAARPLKDGFVQFRVAYAWAGLDAKAGDDLLSAVGVHGDDDIRIRLAICRTIVEAHGGAIEADRRGDDTCVAFTLPLATAAAG